MNSIDCIFCSIASGKIPSSVVYQNNEVIVFKDINPQAPVHLLVVPKEHIEPYKEGFSATQKNLLGALFHAAEEAAKKENIQSSGYRLIVNVGPDSGQEVPHLHLHVLGGKRLGGLVGRER